MIRLSAGLLAALIALPVSAQEPPDSLPPDSVPPAVTADTLEAVSDTLETDSVPPPIRNLPDFGRFGDERDPGVIERWDLEDLLGARAVTLQELLEP
ncbi:MAG TPA: hypothetical protein VJ925_01170, partial [Longimicrobiales bacterium]|nr:hypothetical protein [Longimicrobiales bacterium]